jgi:hypothetical protein
MGARDGIRRRECRREQRGPTGITEERGLDERLPTSRADEHLELNESSLSNGSRSDRFNPHGERDIPGRWAHDDMS